MSYGYTDILTLALLFDKVSLLNWIRSFPTLLHALTPPLLHCALFLSVKEQEKTTNWKKKHTERQQFWISQENLASDGNLVLVGKPTNLVHTIVSQTAWRRVFVLIEGKVIDSYKDKFMKYCSFFSTVFKTFIWYFVCWSQQQNRCLPVLEQSAKLTFHVFHSCQVWNTKTLKLQMREVKGRQYYRLLQIQRLIAFWVETRNQILPLHTKSPVYVVQL